MLGGKYFLFFRRYLILLIYHHLSYFSQFFFFLVHLQTKFDFPGDMLKRDLYSIIVCGFWEGSWQVVFVNKFVIVTSFYASL